MSASSCPPSLGSRAARARRAVLGAGAALSLGAPSVHADDEPFTLDWAAPAGCPDAARVRARVETLLGGTEELLRVGARRIGVRGTVTTASGGAELHLETSVSQPHPPGPAEVLQGERVIQGATCEEVSAAGALVVALSIDPRAVESRRGASATAAFEPRGTDASETPTPSAVTAPAPAPGSDAAPPVASSTSVPPGAPAPTPRSPPERARTEGLLEGQLVGDLGSLPGPSLGAGLGAGFGMGRFATHVRVAYLLPRFASTTPGPEGQARGADVSLVAVDLDGCYAAAPGAVGLEICGAVETGVLLAQGTGFDRSTSAIAPWLGALGSASVVVRALPALTVRAGAGVLLPFGRSHVRFTESTGSSRTLNDLDRPSAVVGRASLGAGLSFW